MTECRKASGPGWELFLGDWKSALAHVTRIDALLCDPPYGARTHVGNADRIESMGRSSLSYASWSPQDVSDFVDSWAPRTSGWMGCMTSDDLIAPYRLAYSEAGRLDFAPVPILQHRPRLGGDGPGSCAVYLCVSRPREARFMSWGSLPGYYLSECAKDGVPGGKPLELMRALIRDYTRSGDLICDPTAGGATTLLAAVMEGRRAIGAEMDEGRFNLARKRLERGFTPSLFAESAGAVEPVQLGLGDSDE